MMYVTTAMLYYRYILSRGMTSYNNKGIFDIFNAGAENIDNSKSLMEKYTIISEYEKFPNLRSLYGKIEKPFEMASKFRVTNTAQKFRDWISNSQGSDSEIDIIREYVDACGKRRGLFEKTPAKFLKMTGMVAIGHFVAPEAHLLGEAVGAILSGVPSAAVDTIVETSAELGLGVIETFMIDNLKVGWTPRAYFDRLHRLQAPQFRGKPSRHR